MTGRRLYDHYCDTTAANFHSMRGDYGPAVSPLPAWPSLVTAERRRWNDLAHRVTPKRKAAR